MIKASQCSAYAAEYKRLAMEPDISIRRATLLTTISLSWKTLANQLNHLTVIIEDESK